MSVGRVLVVDDEPQIRRVLRSTLTARGYEVHDARTGEDALESIRESRFDLVLLDVNMPGMSGLATCRQIRAGSEVAIIMLTVSDSEEDKVAALDAGADDYVTKPFGTPELLARIRAALRRLPMVPERDQSVKVGDLQINLMLRRVVAKDHEIRLTPKEFDLLIALLQRPGRVTSRNELLRAVWGYSASVVSRTVDTHVAELRRKLERDAAEPRHILTVWKVGYKFQR